VRLNIWFVTQENFLFRYLRKTAQIWQCMMSLLWAFSKESSSQQHTRKLHIAKTFLREITSLFIDNLYYYRDYQKRFWSHA